MGNLDISQEWREYWRGAFQHLPTGKPEKLSAKSFPSNKCTIDINLKMPQSCISHLLVFKKHISSPVCPVNPLQCTALNEKLFFNENNYFQLLHVKMNLEMG